MSNTILTTRKAVVRMLTGTRLPNERLQPAPIPRAGHTTVVPNVMYAGLTGTIRCVTIAYLTVTVGNEQGETATAHVWVNREGGWTADYRSPEFEFPVEIDSTKSLGAALTSALYSAAARVA